MRERFECEVFIVTILCIGCLSMVDMTKNEYMCLEFYAGRARLAKLTKALGYPSAAMDWLYDTEGDNLTRNNAMDMNTSGGFVFLASLMGLVWLACRPRPSSSDLAAFALAPLPGQPTEVSLRIGSPS